MIGPYCYYKKITMNLKPETSQCDPYFQLPAQVTSVKERIGLQHFTHRTRERVMNLIKSDAPQFENQGLLHKYYFLDDIHPPVKKKGKPANKGERLNAKEKKKLFCINKQSQLKYATFEKINTLWNDYLKTVMKGSIKDAELRLAKCDYHGAKFAVLAAINPSLVGIVGFVVQETKNTFKMINKHDKIMSKSCLEKTFVYE